MNVKTGSQYQWGMTVAILLIAFNLRAPFTAVSPLIEDICTALSLSNVQMGFVTSIPLFAFAVCSPMIPFISQRLGLSWSLCIGLVLFNIGIVIRFYSCIETFMLGTLIIGIGIAFANVLLPSIMKRYYAEKSASMTSLYIFMMGIGAALGSGIVRPIAHMNQLKDVFGVSGWTLALTVCLPVTFLALMLWFPYVKEEQREKCKEKRSNTRGLWRSSFAWQATGFLSFNAFINYALIGWLPMMLHTKGISLDLAGVYHGVMQFAGILPAFFMSIFLEKAKDKRLLSLGASFTTAIGLISLYLFPSMALFWVICIGFGMGAGFVLGMSMLTLRTESVAQAARLSGMAQSIAYFAAASSPIIMSQVYQIDRTWMMNYTLLLLCCIGWAISGFYACKSQVNKSQQQVQCVHAKSN
ncbi:MFS transporter [Algicola sagamiensis]|uniref:MFS transporter n=1 Tax=Algicola sagamiensis TaxID=163869 RepID=UPI000375A3BD|nr:MFS transporter [Algicola sagamiensis]